MIDPKQKALEIVDKYKNQKVSVLFYEHSIPSIINAEMLDKSAIECAKIHVEGIISTFDVTTPCAKEEWQEVLNELNKM